MIKLINIFKVKLGFVVDFLFTILSFKFFYHQVGFADFTKSRLVFLRAIKKMILNDFCQESNDIELRNLEKRNQDKKEKNQNRKESSHYL